MTAKASHVILARELRRFGLRAEVVLDAILVAGFWTLVAVGLSWLSHWGVEAIGWVLLGIWLGLSVPALKVQLMVLLDLANVALAGRPYLMAVDIRIIRRAAIDPEFRANLDEALRQSKRDRARLPWFARLAITLMDVAWEVSPLAPVSTWGLIVLLRLPELSSVSREDAREAPHLVKQLSPRFRGDIRPMGLLPQ
jgi:hypothetical protein